MGAKSSGGARGVESSHNASVLRIVRRHVRERKRRRALLVGEQRHGLDVQMIGLGHEDVLLLDVVGVFLEPLHESVRAMKDDVAVVANAGRERIDDDGRDLVHQRIGVAAVQDAREPAEGAVGMRGAELLVVVVHDAGLPALVLGIVRGEKDVELAVASLRAAGFRGGRGITRGIARGNRGRVQVSIEGGGRGGRGDPSASLRHDVRLEREGVVAIVEIKRMAVHMVAQRGRRRVAVHHREQVISHQGGEGEDAQDHPGARRHRVAREKVCDRRSARRHKYWTVRWTHFVRVLSGARQKHRPAPPPRRPERTPSCAWRRQ